MFPAVSLLPLLLHPALAKVAGPGAEAGHQAGVKFLDPYVGSYQVTSSSSMTNSHYKDD